MRLLFLVPVVSLLHSIRLVTSSSSSPSFVCTSTSCIEGTCLENDCRCNGGFTGFDCSIPFTICEDGEDGEDGDRTCFNGSECVRNEERDKDTMKFNYHCDCSKAFDVSMFAGENCQYDVTASCQTEGSATGSITTFCTNGGSCVQMLNNPTEGHQGCSCPAEYEGLHCQYLKGEAPAEELAAVAQLQSERDTSHDLTPVAYFFMIAIPMVIIGMFVYFVILKRTTGEKEAEMSEIQNAGEVEFQASSMISITDTDGTTLEGKNVEATKPEIV